MTNPALNRDVSEPMSTGVVQEKWVYGYTPTEHGLEAHPLRQLTDDEYEAVGHAVKVIMDVLMGSTSYSELARRDMATTVESVKEFLVENFRKVEQWGPEVEYRLVSVGAALRMHEESVLATIGKRKDPAATAAAKAIFSATYDRSLAYRIIYSLRNALIHGSKGLTRLGARGVLNADDPVTTELSISLIRQNFSASHAKAAVREEVAALPEDPELIPLANAALDDLLSMQEELQSLLHPQAPAAAHQLFELVREVNAAGLGGPHFHAHDPGDPFANLTQIGMTASVFNYVVAFSGATSADRTNS